jgi:hypothetical protein
MKSVYRLALAFALIISINPRISGSGEAKPDPSDPQPAPLRGGAGNSGCSVSDIAHYTSLRAEGPIVVDGRLDEPSWQKAEKSPSFVDMVSGQPGFYDTRGAVLWDDQYLYVGLWLEEPYVEAHLTRNGSLIFQENDAEVFIDGGDAYSELEINALGTTYQVFFIWRDAYQKGSRFDVPEFDVFDKNVFTFGGNYDRDVNTFWTGTHPRGIRWAFVNREFPGLLKGVHVDGVINDHTTPDKGWTVELAFPWKGMKWLANGRSLPPKPGDTWRIFFGRFELLKPGGVELAAHPAWVWSPHGVYDTHIPECFPYIQFSDKPVGERQR